MNSDLGFEFIKTAPLSDPSKLTAHATGTLRKSIHGTLTRSGSRKRTTRVKVPELALLPEENTETLAPLLTGVVIRDRLLRTPQGGR